MPNVVYKNGTLMDTTLLNKRTRFGA